MTGIYLILLISFIIVFLRNKQLYFAAIPFILLLFDAGFTFFPSNSIITYSKAIIIFLIIISKFKYLIINFRKNPYIAIFIIYTLILLLFSNEFPVSLKNSVKVLPTMALFYISLSFFKAKAEFDNLVKALFFSVIVSFVFGVIGYLFNIGQSYDYGDADLGVVGLLQGGNYYPISIALSIIFIEIIHKDIISIRKFYRYILFVAAIITYLFIILTMRRTAIILPVIGILVIMLNNIKELKKYIPALIFVIVVILSLSPYFYDSLYERYLIRADAGRFESDFYESEARYKETMTILVEIFSFQDPLKSVFGENVFAGGWHGGNVHRMYHTDHGQILSTSGLVGGTIYAFIYISLLQNFFTFRRRIRANNKLLINLNSLFLATILISLATSLNGSIFIVTFRATVFIVLGALHSRITHLLNTKENLSKINVNLRTNKST